MLLGSLLCTFAHFALDIHVCGVDFSLSKYFLFRTLIEIVVLFRFGAQNKRHSARSDLSPSTEALSRAALPPLSLRSGTLGFQDVALPPSGHIIHLTSAGPRAAAASLSSASLSFASVSSARRDLRCAVWKQF